MLIFKYLLKVIVYYCKAYGITYRKLTAVNHGMLHNIYFINK